MRRCSPLEDLEWAWDFAVKLNAIFSLVAPCGYRESTGDAPTRTQASPTPPLPGAEFADVVGDAFALPIMGLSTFHIGFAELADMRLHLVGGRMIRDTSVIGTTEPNRADWNDQSRQRVYMSSEACSPSTRRPSRVSDRKCAIGG